MPLAHPQLYRNFAGYNDTFMPCQAEALWRILIALPKIVTFCSCRPVFSPQTPLYLLVPQKQS